MNTSNDKDNFIKGKPILYSVNPKIQKEINNAISCFIDDYYIEHINIIGNPNNIKMDSNSLNIVIKLSDKKKYLLKKIPLKNINKNSINKITKIMNWIRNYGICIPKLYQSKNGTFFVFNNDSYWILMEYIDGIFFSGNSKQLNETASACSKLLNALSNIPNKLRPLKFKEPYFTDNENEIFSKLKKLEPEWKKIFGKKFTMKLSKNWDYIANQWEFINSHSFINEKYDSVIHHDLHPHNFIFSENKTFIIDYESIVIGAPQSAIGFSIIKLIKNVLDVAPKNISSKDILHLYKEWISKVHNNYEFLNNKNEIEIFGRAEVFRRFLSMSNKTILNTPSSFNGPEIHLDSLFIADKIFSK